MPIKKKKSHQSNPIALPLETVSSVIQKRDALFILICFFLSGIAGLVYEVLWVRIFGKVIGSAPLAVASVLTVFMAGLALGSYIASQKVDRIHTKGDLLWLYGLLECGIGVYGLLLPFFVKYVKPLYVLLYSRLFDNFWLYNLCSFIVCCVLLLLPVMMMGATLPVLTRFFVRQMNNLGQRVGVLYGVNTIGAAVGVVLAGFFMLERLGLWGTILVVACVNLSVGVFCAVLGKKVPRFQTDRVGNTKATVPEIQPAGSDIHSHRDIRLALAVFALSGFCAMGYQVIWTRLLGLLIAPTTYAFSLVVGTFIIGLAIGNVLFGRVADRVKDLMSLLALTQIAAAGFALAASQFLGDSQFFFAKLLFTLQDSFGKAMVVQFLVIFFILFWPTLLLGATFPIVNKIYATTLSGLGRSIGRAYAVNTVGAVLGSFAAGFILIPFWGKEGGLSTLVSAQAALAFIVFGTILKGRSSKPRHWAALCLLGVASIGLVYSYPRWNRDLLSYGRYQIPRELTQHFRRTGWLESVWQGKKILNKYQQGREVVFYGDGIGGFTTVEKHIDSMGTIRYTLLNSGKPDATSHDDAATQALLAHIPLIFHPSPDNVMILGLGSGMTAGEVLHYPVARVDVLEINEQVIKAARFFNDWNNRFSEDPRIRLIVQDGRNHLLLSRMHYDVVISEPSNPWMAGMASLYTKESFETIKDHLNDDGIFIQWVNAGRMDWQTLAMIGKTFGTVFPNSLMMVSPIGGGGADFFFVGVKGDTPLRLSVADRNLSFASRSKIMRLADVRLLFHLILTDRVAEMFEDGVIHSDNRPHLEFAAPRHLYASSRGFETEMKQRPRLSSATSSIIASSRDLDMILNRVELSTSLFALAFPEVDLTDATPEQTTRYQELVKEFCTKRVVQDYTVFYDDRSREICADVQIEFIERHLAETPNDGTAWGDLGVIYAKRSEFDKAKNALERYIVEEPEIPNAYFRLGVLLVMQKNYSKAREQFLKTVSLNPDHAEALLYLAKLNLLYGDKDVAVKYLRQILKTDDNPEARELLRRIEQDG
jgi:spermidine synthase